MLPCGCVGTGCNGIGPSLCENFVTVDDGVRGLPCEGFSASCIEVGLPFGGLGTVGGGVGGMPCEGFGAG